MIFACAVSAQASPRTLTHIVVIGGEDVAPQDPIAHMTVHVRGVGPCSGTIIDHDLIAQLPDGYDPAPVLPSDQVIRQGESVTVAGYGIDSAYSGSGSGVLRKAQVLMDNYAYSAIEVKLDSSHGSSDCNGDSGGPAFVKRGEQYILIGADNWGPPSCNTFSVYAKVPGQRAWLDAAADELRQDGDGEDGSRNGWFFSPMAVISSLRGR